MESNSPIAAKPAAHLSIDLSYITPEQAKQLIGMFDSPEAYAENFSALKAITRGLWKIIMDGNPTAESPLRRMFHTVNDMQGLLLLDDMQEVEQIIYRSGLMPRDQRSFYQKGGQS